MTDPRNRNELWGRVLMDELARSGVRHLIVSPGSRSAPLVLSAAADARFRIRVQIDERAAGFLALGVGKATGLPAAVVTTSGTAVANLLAPVVEAAQAGTPLLLLTADRPAKLRGADANQTIVQPGIFGGYLRLSAELSPADLSEGAVRHLRSVACRAIAAAVGDPGGPVHLNLPFDKPLEPTFVPGDLPPELAAGGTPASRGRAGGSPWTRILPHRAGPTPEAIAVVVEALGKARRPLLVAGVLPRPWEAGPALRHAAAALEIPLLADGLSGARYPSEVGVERAGGIPEATDRGAPVVGGYDLALRAPRVGEALRPDLVIRFGASPTSAVLLEWLSALEGTPHLLVDGGGRWKDHAGLATAMIPADPVRFAEALLASVPDRMERDPGWRTAWSQVEEGVVDALHGVVRTPVFDGAIMGEVVRGLGGSDLLFISSSLPVRDLDAFVPRSERPLLALGNRGASGIDGIVSTAAGAALATGRRVVTVLGDLALLHDSNGLSVLRDPEVRVTLVVVNNDGGGIFHLLPIREHEPAFTPYFATPHGRSLEHLARLHGLPYLRVEGRSFVAAESATPVACGADSEDPVAAADAGAPTEARGIEGLRLALDWMMGRDGSGIVEIRTDREENRRRRLEVTGLVASAAADALTDEGA